MGCICEKEVLFFGEGSRDTSHLLYIFLTVYRCDLIGLKNRRFWPVENDRKGKNGLISYNVFFLWVANQPPCHALEGALNAISMRVKVYDF